MADSAQALIGHVLACGDVEWEPTARYVFKLGGKGDVFAAPKSSPQAMQRVGAFSARRLSAEWDMRNPIVSRIVTDKVLPERATTTGVRYPF